MLSQNTLGVPNLRDRYFFLAKRHTKVGRTGLSQSGGLQSRADIDLFLGYVFVLVLVLVLAFVLVFCFTFCFTFCSTFCFTFCSLNPRTYGLGETRMAPLLAITTATTRYRVHPLTPWVQLLTPRVHPLTPWVNLFGLKPIPCCAPFRVAHGIPTNELCLHPCSPSPSPTLTIVLPSPFTLITPFRNHPILTFVSPASSHIPHSIPTPALSPSPEQILKQTSPTLTSRLH